MSKRRQEPKEKLVVRHETQGNAEYYHFTFEPLGWAIFNINERTGEFSIQSDWGNYGHRWPMGYGVPNKDKNEDIDPDALKKFICRCDANYITTKFSYDLPRSSREQFDIDAFKESIRDLICRTRREQETLLVWEYNGRTFAREKKYKMFTKEWAREAWNELDDVCGHADSYGLDSQTTLIMENWPSSLEWVEELWEHFVFKPSPRLLFVQETLLPFFQNWLRPRVT